MQPSGGMAVRHQKGATAGRFFYIPLRGMSEKFQRLKHATSAPEIITVGFLNRSTLVSACNPLVTKINNNNCSAVTPFRRLTAMSPERSTRAQVLSGCPNLDRSSLDSGI
ncbi:hypothetical protein T265_10229 [Opisthorchis viverrini]|uniref:Uncharacterized protein n=1 Tax=Opisthorchis viverrini TaxID=6198 RepID=A0A074Z2Z1_OPIVI|nr:hypothetical protein T265_10229 [Opisthorchis viverrini]KER21436.1 hypothetical protein T265_10229 [Opisthorchis viverrini]